jgi:ATP-binding cassette subfamily B protein
MSDRRGAVPTSLLGQFRRHAPRYGLGLLLLGAYQSAQYWFDTRLRLAVNDALGTEHERAVELGLGLVAVTLAAFVVRVLSRVVVFNAGRNAEYELRHAVEEHLLRLGPSFYRRMSTGEIMSRVTNDLVQVRLLLGFGVLNLINTVFALVSALAVTIPISGKLTLAALAPLPLLSLVARRLSSEFYTRTRDNQAALGHMSSRVQSSIAGVRVIRSFSLEQAEVEAFERTNQAYLDKSLAALLNQLGRKEGEHDHDQDRERGALEEAAHELARIPRAKVIRRVKTVKATRGIAGPKRVCAVWCAILCVA